jgi:hypothetical protein
MFFVLCAPLTKKADKQTRPSLAWDIKQDNPILIFFFHNNCSCFNHEIDQICTEIVPLLKISQAVNFLCETTFLTNLGYYHIYINFLSKGCRLI